MKVTGKRKRLASAARCLLQQAEQLLYYFGDDNHDENVSLIDNIRFQALDTNSNINERGGNVSNVVAVLDSKEDSLPAEMLEAVAAAEPMDVEASDRCGKINHGDCGVLVEDDYCQSSADGRIAPFRRDNRGVTEEALIRQQSSTPEISHEGGCDNREPAPQLPQFQTDHDDETETIRDPVAVRTVTSLPSEPDADLCCETSAIHMDDEPCIHTGNDDDFISHDLPTDGAAGDRSPTAVIPVVSDSVAAWIQSCPFIHSVGFHHYAINVNRGSYCVQIHDSAIVYWMQDPTLIRTSAAFRIALRMSRDLNIPLIALALVNDETLADWSAFKSNSKVSEGRVSDEDEFSIYQRRSMLQLQMLQDTSEFLGRSEVALLCIGYDVVNYAEHPYTAALTCILQCGSCMSIDTSPVTTAALFCDSSSNPLSRFVQLTLCDHERFFPVVVVDQALSFAVYSSDNAMCDSHSTKNSQQPLWDIVTRVVTRDCCNLNLQCVDISKYHSDAWNNNVLQCSDFSGIVQPIGERVLQYTHSDRGNSKSVIKNSVQMNPTNGCWSIDWLNVWCSTETIYKLRLIDNALCELLDIIKYSTNQQSIEADVFQVIVELTEIWIERNGMYRDAPDAMLKYYEQEHHRIQQQLVRYGYEPSSATDMNCWLWWRLYYSCQRFVNDSAAHDSSGVCWSVANKDTGCSILKAAVYSIYEDIVIYSLQDYNDLSCQSNVGLSIVSFINCLDEVLAE